MSVKIRMTDDSYILIAGDLKDKKSEVDFKGNGDLHVNKIYTELEGFKTSDTVDTSRFLDGNKTFNNSDSISDFLSWFFGIDIKQVKPNQISFRDGGIIVCNNIKENQILGE